MKLELPILITCGVISTAIAVVLWNIKRMKKFVPVGRIKSLYFYPIKSLRRIEVFELEVTSVGVKHLGVLERNFMLISDENALISQREEPSLALLSVSMTKDTIIVKDSEGNVLKVDTAEDNYDPSELIPCKLHEFIAETIDCGEVAAKFFQSYLKRNDVRLVRGANKRYTGKPIPLIESVTKNKFHTLQDFAPLNMLSQSSVDALNAKMENPVTAHNFRANVLFEGSPAFDEDNWKHIKFSSGTAVDHAFPCGRCVMTTNDPETGIKTNKEPLVTLRKFRIADDPNLNKVLHYSPCLGINCWIVKSGSLSVGDTMYAVIQKGYVTVKNKESST